jgi:O-antigen/teichoic acid export membrane protein
VAQTLGAKLVGIFGQIALAWYLRPEDFGAVGLAYTVAAFAGLIQQSGLKEILIQRQRHFRRWANAAFWLSITLGLLAASIMVLAAPVAARLYKSPQLPGLVTVLALAVPLDALCVVPFALLHIHLRFRALAVLSFLGAATTTGLTVFFAYHGFGPYSFVLPRPLVALLQVAVLWWLTKPRIRSSLQIRRWSLIIGDMGLITAAWVCYTVIAQGDYVILGMRHPAYIVGIYYFAFNLSRQTFAVLNTNLWGVLMPALTRLQDQPQRQLQAFLSASRTLAVVGVPLSLLQAALADPIVHLIFGQQWLPSIHVLEVLTLGATLMLVGSPGVSLLQARGRFRLMLKVAMAFAPVFVILVAVAAYAGAALSVAIAVAIFYGFYGVAHLYAAIRPIGGTWSQVWEVYAAGLGPAVLSNGTAYLLGHLLAGAPDHWLRLAIILSCSVMLYPPLLRWLAPRAWQELLHRLRGLIPRPSAGPS